MKINITNKEKLNQAINEVQGKATARTIDADSVEYRVKQIEEKLSTVLHKKDWVGIKAQIDHNGQDFPNAYKYTPNSTVVYLKRTGSGWFVTQIGRCVTSSANRQIVLTFPEGTAEKMADFVSISGRW